MSPYKKIFENGRTFNDFYNKTILFLLYVTINGVIIQFL